MTFEVRLKNKSISEYIGNLTFGTSEDTLGMMASFDVVYRGKEIANVGDVIQIFKEKTRFFWGRIIDIQKDGKNPRKVTCFDNAFYLNENEAIIQFKNIQADKAIEQLLDKYGISSRKITKLPYKIKKIYKGVKVSEIIKDILDQCSKISGAKYFFEMQDKTFVVAKRGFYEIKKYFNVIMNPSVTESMKNMKTRVIVTNSDGESIKSFISLEDKNAIKKFGLLTKVEQIDDKEKSKAKKIAQELLKSLNKIEITASLSLLGSINIQANRVIALKETTTGIVGKYYIKSASHSVNAGTHIVSIEVGEFVG